MDLSLVFPFSLFLTLFQAGPFANSQNQWDPIIAWHKDAVSSGVFFFTALPFVPPTSPPPFFSHCHSLFLPLKQHVHPPELVFIQSSRVNQIMNCGETCLSGFQCNEDILNIS